MKKRLMSTLLMGALFVASVSVFTSCKDYDDDISNLQIGLESVNKTLTTEKDALAVQIASLKNQLEQKDAELATLLAQIQENSEAAQEANAQADQANADAIKATNEALTKAVEERVAAMANLEARIKTAEEAQAKINDMLNGKVDDLNAALKDVFAQIEAVDNNLGDALKSIDILKEGLNNSELAMKALIADFQAQNVAIQAYQARIAELEGQVAGLAAAANTSNQRLAGITSELNEKIAILENTLNELISNKAIDSSLSYAKSEELRAYVAQLDEKLAAAQRNLSQLNVLADKTLKSLVFEPQIYYWGVEGLYVDVLKFNRFNVLATGYKNTEVSLTGTFDVTGLGIGYTYAGEPDWTTATIADNADALNERLYGGSNATDHRRYARLNPNEGKRVLDTYARYHMNPSSASLDDAKVELLSGDKDYVRAAACGLNILEWQPVAGMLEVKLGVDNPDAIGRVQSLTTTSADDKVTVFATQVTVKSGENDTTITSDYATLFQREIRDLVITHKDSRNTYLSKKYYANPYATGVHNSHCGLCDQDNYGSETIRTHAMATAGEAIQFDPQDQVLWNDTLVLNKVVEVHFTDQTGKHATWTEEEVNDNGLHFEFELTGYFVGDSKTSESAHAAIKEFDGEYWFRPQNPERETGLQQEWGAEQSRANLVGRTPLVRVKLIDDATGSIVDYAYIRILISDVAGPEPEDPGQWSHVYGPQEYDIQHNFNCDYIARNWSFATSWIQTEYDLYHELDITRAEFENKYQLTPAGYAEPEKDADGNYLQYYVTGFNADGKNHYQYTFAACDAVHPYFGAFDTWNTVDAEGRPTSTLQWTFNAAQTMAMLTTEYAGDSVRANQYKLINSITDGTQANGNANQIWRAVRYVAKTGPADDLYVLFKINPIKITNNVPVANVNWDPKKINEYWYQTNGNVAGSGKDEIHTNVLAPEDVFPDKDGVYDRLGDVMDNLFSDVFAGNKLSNADYLQITDPTNGEFARNQLTLHLRFDRKNNGKEVKGIDGQTYVLRVYENPASFQNYGGTGLFYYNQNDTLLQACLKSYVTRFGNVKAVPQIYFRDVAVIRVAEPVPANQKLIIDNEYVYYFHNCAADSADYVGLNSQYNTEGAVDYRDHTIAELLLNYKAHNELADDVINAIVGINAVNACPKWLKLTNNTFDVRFLRPINVQDCKCTKVIDASTNELQVIHLQDLIQLTDWRDAWKNGRYTGNGDADYWEYYNIKAIEIDGLRPGGNPANFIRTDLNQVRPATPELGNAPLLNTVTSNLDIQYKPNFTTKANGCHDDVWATGSPRWLSEFGDIEYRNISATVGEFHLYVPVRVTYEWGYITIWVTITVNKTVGNA